ncbi:Ulp1 protease family protein [Aspergillus sclerotialis]|uniref:Ulp1 protease family protein n=1 Tax=Aspergillus sclerotialis TaxID=2070753 RepID=A0A3A2ZKC4_9EURO|nr:Ulp1 protease family protein [Aspergillus sclerotialis]
MPLLESISNLINTWSPRRQTSTRPPHPPPSDGISDSQDRSEPRRSMRTTNQSEEGRLLGNYSPGRDAVPIVPGATFKNKNKSLQDFSTFRPQNTLSGKSKESGPVRPRGNARGRPRNRYGGRSRLEHTMESGEERPAKKQRRDYHTQASGRQMSSDDDEASAHAPKGALSPAAVKQFHEMSSPNAARMRNPWEYPGALGEYRYVEPSNQSLRDQFIATDGAQRNPDIKGRRRSSDSPDELQGEITVKPSLSPVIRGGKADANTAAGYPDRLSSPSDIRPTDFTSRRSNRKSRPGKEHHKHMFDAVLVRVGQVERLSSDGGTFEICVNNTSIEVAGDGDSGCAVQVPLTRFTQLIQGEKPSSKVRLRMSKTEMGDQMDIELSSPDEKTRFTSLLRQWVGVQDKPSNWMDNAFKKTERDTSRFANGSKHPSENIDEKSPEQRPEVPKRPKLSASLQDDHGNTNGDLSYLSRPPRKSGNNSIFGSHSHPEKTYSSFDRINNFRHTATNNRETRSMFRRQPLEPIICDDDDEEVDSPKTPDLQPGKWNTPLVYPRVGKNTAEVHAQDRERLRDNEFLNDNLIGFYIRFLEDHLNRRSKDVAKRVYFFNSFFFTTITNTPRGQRGINYRGVEKWTRNVDLFSYDYIVVPINEAAHWYVAIICNLPFLEGVAGESQDTAESDKNSRLASEAREIPETPVASQELGESTTQTRGSGSKEEATRASLATMSLVDGTGPGKENPTADEDWPENEENQTTPQAKFTNSAGKQDDTKESSQTSPARQATSSASQKGKKAKKKPIPPIQRYNTTQPVIITFDSLDLARSPTISTLREYLSHEAKSKKGIEIDTKNIRGMRARQIPLQKNFSDCGLYLLAYLEKFIQDPDLFVKKLLRKEMQAEGDWPPLKSGLLRRRLKDFLDRLYDEQELVASKKEIEGGLLADKSPVDFLLGSETVEKGEGESSPVDNPDEDGEENGDTSRNESPEQPSKSRDGTPHPDANSNQDEVGTEEVSKDESPDATDQAQPSNNQEIIEVPDSQDGGKVTCSAKSQESRSGDEQKDIVSVEDEGGSGAANPDPKEKTKHEDTGAKAKGSIIEVQVSGTPSPDSRKNARKGRGEGVRSPKSTKGK